MKKILLLFVGGLCGYTGFGQSLSPSVNATSGDYYTSSNSSLSWTIGECITETFSSTNNKLTQGFHQSSYTITSIEENSDGNYSVIAYPNPTNNFISVSVNSKEVSKLKVDLFDITGKLLHSEKFQNQILLDLSYYSIGMYFIRVYNEKENLVKSFKLQKTN